MIDEKFKEQIELYLPKYLSPDERKYLLSELSSFPDNMRYYLASDKSRTETNLLQGDGWKGFALIDFYSFKKRRVAGVVLSNSCDIAIENQRSLPVRIIFSPLVSLAKYEERLRKNKTAAQIDNILTDIRKQRSTSIFYLPEYSGFLEESIILLDNVHCHPVDDFMKVRKAKIFTLSQYGFYVFLIKLSIHFTRFQENVHRFPAAV